MPLHEACEVITFYSYTGGSGRSMALANVACLLARRCPPGRGVLMVDWNLESPSLHRFYHASDEHPGLLDLFVDLDTRIPASGSDDAPVAVERVQPDRFVLSTEIPSLSLLKAGRFDGYYFSAVSSFQWAALHERAPGLINALLDHFGRRYRFILIDSPSGVNDMSGVCAMMIPDKLVAAFTPSRQSLLGALEVAGCAADYRRNSGSTRALAIYPLPSKIEGSEPELRHDWRFGGPAGDVLGYQPRFEALFGELQPGSAPSLEDYFNAVQIPYMPRYSYGDQVAAAGHLHSGSPLLRAYQNLAARLLQSSQPWDACDPGADLNVIEVDGRILPLAEAQALCLEATDARSLQTLAVIKERLGKPEEAESHYLEAIALHRAKGHGPEIAEAVSGLARLERLMGRFEESRVYYLNAAKLYRAQPSNGALASTLAILGDLDCQVGETDAAALHYQEAVERYRHAWDDIGVARTLMKLSDLEKRQGNLDPAQEHYRQAAQFFQKERDNSGLAVALENLGEVQNRCGKLEPAEENYARAVQLYRCEGETLHLAHALRCLADLHRTLKKGELAIVCYQESIELFRREGENLGLATALQNLADLETRTGRQDAAKLHYAEAAVLYRKEGNNLGVANTLRSSGDLERRLGHFDAARHNYEEAMELYRGEGNSLGLANSLQSLGDLEKRTAKTAEAVERYTQAIQIYRKEGAALGLANTLKSLGEVETEGGNVDVARDHYQQAIELYRITGRTLGLANALQGLGDLERLQKRFKEATTHYTTARDLYRQERYMSGLAYTCSELARVSHALFDFGGSIDYLSEAMSAARDSNAASVVEYVRGVQREIHGIPVTA